MHGYAIFNSVGLALRHAEPTFHPTIATFSRYNLRMTLHFPMADGVVAAANRSGWSSLD